MNFILKNQKKLKWLFLCTGILISIIWFAYFPLNPPYDIEDVIIEGLILTSTCIAYLYITRFENGLVEAGFGLFVVGLLIDFFDEFTKEPGILNTQIEGFLIITGLFLFAFGLSTAYKKFRYELSNAREREEKIKESEEKFRNLIENISEAVYEIDRNGILIYTSPKIHDLLGYSPTELPGIVFYTLSSPGSKEETTNFFEDRMAKRDSFRLFEHTLLHKDGNEVTVQTNGTPVFHDSTFCGYRIVSRDITDRKSVEETLRIANQKLNLLSNITRHDVLNQLTVILGNLEISKDYTTDSRLLKIFEKERLSAEKIFELISFTGDYQEIGVKSPTWQKIQDVVEKSLRNLDFKNIIQDIRLDNVEIFADPLLEKVFFNLLENILRHGNSVSKISLTYTQNHSGLTIICEDDGIGIPQEEKKLIFTREFGKNTGYGLFLSSEILSITGISIKETGEFGKGAFFEIHVPKGMYRIITN
jgi:PAS domain S-box-containing protein